MSIKYNVLYTTVQRILIKSELGFYITPPPLIFFFFFKYNNLFSSAVEDLHIICLISLSYANPIIIIATYVRATYIVVIKSSNKSSRSTNHIIYYYTCTFSEYYQYTNLGCLLRSSRISR